LAWGDEIFCHLEDLGESSFEYVFRETREVARGVGIVEHGVKMEFFELDKAEIREALV
jgi:hypothetical protein